MAYETFTKDQLRAAARAAAAKHGLDPVMFEAQIAQESGYDQAVVQGKRKSSAGAVGIAQFMPKTAKALGVDPLDPIAALDASATYLATLTKKFGSEDLGRLAYNWGEGNVAKYLRNPEAKAIPKEARDYNMLIAKRAGREAAPLMAGATSPPTAAPKQSFVQTALASAEAGLPPIQEQPVQVSPGVVPPEAPVQQAAAPVQQAAAPVQQAAAEPQGIDPMAWMRTLEGANDGQQLLQASIKSNDSFLAHLEDSATKAQDSALASMFSDTPLLAEQKGPRLPGAVDRYLDKLLA